MKVSKKILFLTFFIICLLINISFADTGKVSIQATRVRQEANTTSTIMTVIYENDEVDILEESGEWYKIKYGEYTGYVKKEYIKLNEESTQNSNTSNQVASNTTNSEVTTTSTNSNNLIISSETYAKFIPSFFSKNVVKFEVAKQVEKIKEINNWIQVSDGTNTGWILKSKVQENQETQVTNDDNQNTVVNEISNTANTISNTASNTNTVSNTSSNNNSNNINKTAKITVETAKVREEATTQSNVLGFLDYGDEVVLLEQIGDWYRIDFENKTGYIKNTLFSIIEEDAVSSRSLSEERQEETDAEPESTVSNTNTSEVVNYAKQYLGYPYIVGGKNPSTGFDCSGFTRYVYLNFGYSLSATSASQADYGAEVSRENLQPGDLILFLNEEKTKIGHTGIYIGNGEFIHSANPQRGVVIDNMNTNSYYNERFSSARRIINT